MLLGGEGVHGINADRRVTHTTLTSSTLNVLVLNQAGGRPGPQPGVSRGLPHNPCAARVREASTQKKRVAHTTLSKHLQQIRNNTSWSFHTCYRICDSL